MTTLGAAVVLGVFVIVGCVAMVVIALVMADDAEEARDLQLFEDRQRNGYSEWQNDDAA
jgi:hypothetical protein